MLRFLKVLVGVSTLVLAWSACSWQWIDMSEPLTYLQEVTPACVPYPGGDRDPCERRVPWSWPSLKYPIVMAGYAEPDPVPSIRQLMDEEFESIAPLPHQVARGVVVPNSTRCASYTGRAVMRGYQVLWVPGGSHIRCFVDVAVREYLVGAGPERITLQMGVRSNDQQSSTFGTVPRDAEYFADIASPMMDALEGYEWVFWLNVPFDPAIETWGSSNYWSVQRTEEGSVVAVHRWSGRHSKQEQYGNLLEIPLDKHAKEVKVARQYYVQLYGGRVSASPDSPDVIATSHRLSLVAFLRSISAYDVPGFTTSPPPPAPDIHVP